MATKRPHSPSSGVSSAAASDAESDDDVSSPSRAHRRSLPARAVGREATLDLLRAQVAAGASALPSTTASSSTPPAASPAPPTSPAVATTRRSDRHARKKASPPIALEINGFRRVQEKHSAVNRLHLKVFSNGQDVAHVVFQLGDSAACDDAVKRLKQAQRAQELAKKIKAGIKTEHSDVKTDEDLSKLRVKRGLWPDAVIKAAQKLSPPVDLRMLTLVKKGHDEDNKIPIQIFNENGGKLDYKNPLRPHSNDYDVNLLALEERQVANAIGETPMYKLRLRVPSEVGAKHGIIRNASLSLGAVRRPGSTFQPRAINKERFNVTTHDTYMIGRAQARSRTSS